MDPETIKRIAAEVGHYLPDYRWTLAVQLVLTVLAAGAAAFVGSYWKTRGQNLATKADFQMLQDQLRAQTRLVEEIKSEVSQKDWAARQRAEVRRVKLEELLNKAGESMGYLKRLEHASIEGRTLGGEDRNPADDFSSLAALYFPELKKETGEYLLSLREMAGICTTLANGILAADIDKAPRAHAYADFTAKYHPVYAQSLAHRDSLDKAARKLIVQIMEFE